MSRGSREQEDQSKAITVLRREVVWVGGWHGRGGRVTAWGYCKGRASCVLGQLHGGGERKKEQGGSYTAMSDWEVGLTHEQGQNAGGADGGENKKFGFHTLSLNSQ